MAKVAVISKSPLDLLIVLVMDASFMPSPVLYAPSIVTPELKDY